MAITADRDGEVSVGHENAVQTAITNAPTSNEDGRPKPNGNAAVIASAVKQERPIDVKEEQPSYSVADAINGNDDNVVSTVYLQ